MFKKELFFFFGMPKGVTERGWLNISIFNLRDRLSGSSFRADHHGIGMLLKFSDSVS
jgi:hypothetical protein